MSQRGAIAILPVVTAVMTVGFVAAVYMGIQQHQRNADDARQMQGTIIDLRYQLTKDQLALATPTPTPVPSPTPTATPAVLGAQSLAIPELGIKLTPAAPLSDLKYAMVASKATGGLAAGLTSASFVAKYPACKPGTALGQVIRMAKGKNLVAPYVSLSTLGDYSYYYYPPTNTCATSVSGKAEVAADRSALQSAILKTITN